MTKGQNGVHKHASGGVAMNALSLHFQVCLEVLHASPLPIPMQYPSIGR